MPLLALVQPSPDLSAFLMELLRKNATEAPLFVIAIAVLLYLFKQPPPVTKRAGAAVKADGDDNAEEAKPSVEVTLQFPSGELAAAVREVVRESNDERFTLLEARVGEIESRHDAEDHAREVAEAEERGREAERRKQATTTAVLPENTGPRRRG